MKLQFNLDALGSTLPVMFYGMLGGIAVMALLCGALMLLYAAGKRK